MCKKEPGGIMKKIVSTEIIHNPVLRKLERWVFTVICLCLLCCSGNLILNANAASEMKASDSCIEFIKAVEGFSSVPYYDYGQYTVGYGTQCPTEKYFEYKANGIPKKEAEELLHKEITEIEETLSKKFISPYGLAFSQHQFDALVSFSYNIGPGWITYDSSLRNAILRNADSDELVYAFGLYCTAGGKYLPGLVTRRLCEADMYLNGRYSKALSNEYGYVYYDANGGSVEYRVQGYRAQSNTAPAAAASRSGDTFLGWYTDLTGGTKVDTLNGALTGKTLFAHWLSDENNTDQNGSATTVKVTGDAVNVRTGPGTNYAVVKRVYRNETVTVTHITHLTNMKWGKIPAGWICLDFTNYDDVVSGNGNTVTSPDGAEWWDEEDSNWDTTPDNPPSVPDNPPSVPDNSDSVTGTVKVSNYLIIRGGAGTSYPSVGFLFNGNQVEILEQKTAEGRTWGRISNGWVCMDYITTGNASANTGTSQKPADSNTTVESTSIRGKITADALRIRSGAGTGNPIVGFYYQNDTVTVSEKVRMGSVTWGKTDRGWISMDYFSANAADAPGAEYWEPVRSSTKTVRADCLRIRSDAGTNNKIVGFLYDGDTVTVLETKTVGSVSWGRISQGWICMEYVK